MKLTLTPRLRVVRYGNRRDFDSIQILVKQWRIGRMTIWQRTLDSEEVPAFAGIAGAIFGDSAGWRSKFAPFDDDGIKQA